MDDRIQKALDGDLDDRLSPAEARAVEAAEAGIRAVLGSIPSRPLPDLGPAVLARIGAGEPGRVASAGALPGRGRLASVLDFIWRPRLVRLRPVWGLASAALVVLLVTGRSAPAVPAASAQVLTQFVLHAPDARDVLLAGDFTNWQPAHRMTRAESGVWTVVVPLDPGVHDYAFVVDGERWVADPNAPAVDDGFGGLNSRLAVLAPDAEVL